MSVSSASSSHHGYPFLFGKGKSKMNEVTLPPFKLTEKQAREGKVEILVKDQYGSVVRPDFRGNNGVYNSTFLPSSPGDYVVSIRVDDEDLEGSPFIVKVFDPSLIKVLNLSAAVVNTPNTFSVSTAGIGEGPLTITIVNLSTNQVLPAQIIADASTAHLFHVQWMPVEACFVKININFAGVEALGSPFKVEVIDPCMTTLSGAGLGGFLQLNTTSFFRILTPTNLVVINQVKAVLIDPTGNQVNCRVVDGGSGAASIELVPFVVGPHRLEVLYFGKPIRSSPFSFNAYDSSRVRILNWKSTGYVKKTVEFDVDISKAGPGDFAINVSGGEAPYKIKEKEAGKYRVSYTPEQPGVLDFTFSFNKKKINGGPWTCTIQSPPTASVSGNGVRTSPPLPINVPTTFQVKLTGAINGDLDVHVIDPTGQSVQCDLVSYQNLVYVYRYTPHNVGTYNIEVKMEDREVTGSPFHSRAYSPGSVILGEVSTGFVGKTVSFNIDTSQAGEGELEVLVEKGVVPCVVTAEGPRGQHIVTFVPKEAKVHSISVSFNGQVVRGSPLSVNILDPSRVTLLGRGDECKVPVAKPCSLRLNIAGAGVGTFTAIATAPSGAEIPLVVKETSQRLLDLEYTPREVGIHGVQVELEGVVVPISPITVSAYDISKIRVREIKDGVVNQQNRILVESGDPGEGDLTFSVYGPNGQLLNNSIEQHSSSTYSILFTPLQPGYHQFVASFNNESVQGSPFTFNVYDLSSISVSGKSLTSFPCNKMTSFVITSSDTLRAANCFVKILDPRMQHVAARLFDVSDGSVKVEFIGNIPGDYRIEVRAHGELLTGSPFISKGWDISKVVVTPVHQALVSVQSSFNISVKEAGEGTLEIGITNPSGQQVPNNVTSTSPGQFVVSFTPSTSGTHQADITFNAEAVNGSPFNIEVNDPRKATARGEGLDLVRCNKPTHFIVSCPGVNTTDLNVNITGPKNSNVRHRLVEQSEGIFRVDYTPTNTGDYLIEISIYERTIPGSPFIAKCWDSQRVTCTKVTSARVGQQCSFNLDASLAGEGDIEIVVHGPSGSNLSNHVTPLGPGIFTVNFVPMESGMHKATVNFNHEHVLGSPFSFNVIDLARASARGEGLGLVKVNTTAPFTITAPGASLRDLEVYVYAPNGKEVNYHLNEAGSGAFRVEYTPNHPGDYRIEVSYFGQTLPGSPFFTKAWDPSRVFVTNVKNSKVGYNNTFNLDVNEAGEGTLEIGVTDPSGHNIHNSVSACGPGKFEVVCAPEEAGKHKVVVTFNKENVPGSPFFFLVTDISKVTVRGDGARVVKSGTNASFVVYAPAAQQKDLQIVIHDPDHNELLTRVTETGNNNFRVDYTPRTTGTHNISIHYFGQPLPTCPLPVEVWDASKARFNVQPTCKVNQNVSFKVDLSNAGKGDIEVEVTHTNGRSVPVSVTSFHNSSSACEATLTPVEAGQHRVCVFMNKEHIMGSPTTFLAIDPSRSHLRGQGLRLVPCNKVASFSFTAPAANQHDLQVKITGPDYRDVAYRMVESIDMFEVEYTPHRPGDYNIEVVYFGEMLSGCPFTSHAFDPSLVQVTPIRYAIMNKEASFNVNTTKAGNGTLEVSVTADGHQTAAIVKHVSDGIHNACFIPQQCCMHEVTVKFNGHNVSGSPFRVQVIDGSLATATGEGLAVVRVGSTGAFEVRTNNPPFQMTPAPIEVIITNERNQTVTSRVNQSSSTSFNVEYVPREAGAHKIEVRYAGQSIQNSPFMAQAVDSSLARIIHTRQGVVGKSYEFEVDATKCGGVAELVVEVRGQRSSPRAHVVSARGIFRVSFVATEACTHQVNVTYFGDAVPDSPFSVDFIDPDDMSIDWRSLERVPVEKPVCIDLQLGRNNINALQSRNTESSLNCWIRDPLKRDVPCTLERTSRSYQLTFTPYVVGPHRIEVTFGNSQIEGSPFTCQVYNLSKVLISQATTENCVGKESSFVVDWSDAGEGEVSVELLCGSSLVACQAVPQNEHSNRYIFMPKMAKTHRAVVRFNSDPVPGSPVLFEITDPTSSITLVSRQTQGVCLAGGHLKAHLRSSTLLDPHQVAFDAREPDGHSILTTKAASFDGSIEVTFPALLAGLYSLSATYCGHSVAGSPLHFDVVDPSKVVAQVPPTGEVGKSTSFDVRLTGAGQGDVSVSVFDYNGVSVVSSVQKEASGHKVRFVPESEGAHRVQVTFAGQEVNGSPFQHHVTDSFSPRASGQGLVAASQGVRTSFRVHTDGRPGAVEVTIQGPRNAVVASVDGQDHDGATLVSYTPSEAGLHTISVYWQKKHVAGSPFQVAVDGSGDVTVEGGWESLVNHFGRMALVVNQRKVFVLDCSRAGTGHVRVLVQGPKGQCPAEVVPLAGDRVQVSFIPPWEGDYTIQMFHNDKLVNSTFLQGTAVKSQAPEAEKPAARPQASGEGLHSATVCSASSFTVVTSDENASVRATIIGVDSEIPVQVNKLGSQHGIFECSYSPKTAGLYMVTVTSNNEPVPGSPFRLRVVECDHAPAPKPCPELPPVIQVVQPPPAVPALPPYATGLGLREGKISLTSEFTIENALADPEIQLVSSHSDVLVRCFKVAENTYRCSYIPTLPGVYMLHIHVNGVPINGSPYKVVVEDHEATCDHHVYNGHHSCDHHAHNHYTCDSHHPYEQHTCDNHHPYDHHPVCGDIPNALPYYNHQTVHHHHEHPTPALHGPPYVDFYGVGGAQNVVVMGEGLNGAFAGQAANFMIDASNAGEGQLAAMLVGIATSVEVYCQQLGGGQFNCSYTARQPGAYLLNITWGDQPVPGSPFKVNVSGQDSMHGTGKGHVDPSRVVVSGRGLEDGVLATFDSSFTVDTRGAGPGQLNCKMKGKKGTFKIEMQRDPTQNRLIHCCFNPTEVGEYVLETKWSGHHVPGSPHHIHIFDTHQELGAFCSQGGHYGAY